MSQFVGRIIRGEGIARTTGYPTLNLDRASLKGRLPKRGVWAVRAGMNERSYRAILVLGVPYQRRQRTETKIEVHLLRNRQVRNGITMTVQPVAFIRPIRVFSSRLTLIATIKNDREKALLLLK
jgi:riboflavin kinase / FMN adenylyltransferase